MDGKQNSGSPDKDRVNVTEDYELQYWSNKFNVNVDQLRSAVKAVGTISKDVEAYLKK